MPRDSDTPQRIPKRQVREGRAAVGRDAAEENQAKVVAESVAEPAQATSSATKRRSSHVNDKGTRARRVKKAATVTNVPKLNTAAVDKEESIWQRFRAWMKTAPALSFSLLLHIVAFVGLGAVTFVTWEPEKELLITASSVDATEAPIEELAEIDMGELEEFEEETFESEIDEMSDVVLEDVSIDAPVAEAIPEMAGAAPAVGSSNNTGDKATAKSSKKAGKKGAQAKANFFGAPAQGNRFAFIVDNSNSMVKGKMLTTIDQLLRTVNSLTVKQEFYVIFYSDAAYPMFYPSSEPDWIPANKANKARLYDWLQTVELCSGGRLDLALQKAFELEPDSVFLVGDGSDVGKQEEKVITEQTKSRRYVIHTLCIGGNGKGAEKLKGISDYTGGTFRFVQPNPNFVQMAKTVKFKMNKTRGTVWGKNIAK